MQGNLHRPLTTIKHEHAIRLVTAKAFRPYLITECGNKSDVGLLLTLKKDKTMSNNTTAADAIYTANKRELVKHLAVKIIRKKHITNALKLSYKLLGISAIFVSGMAFCHSIFN